MAEGKMILIEKGSIVIIRDSNDIEVGFSSIEQFNNYCSDFEVSLHGKYYLDYEPEKNLYIDDILFGDRFNHYDENINNGLVNEYELLITNAEIIKNRVDNPFYLLSLEDAKQLKKEFLRIEAKNIIYTKWPPFKQINYALGVEGYTNEVELAQIKYDISLIVGISNNAEASVDSATDKDQVKNIIVNWPTI